MEKRENLTGHPSDYGSRTLEQQRTADGDPLIDRGSADDPEETRSDDLQGDTDFQQTNADPEKL